MLTVPAGRHLRIASRSCKHFFTLFQREEHMMWRLVFGPSRFCAPDAMFLGEGARHFGRRLGLRISSKYRAGA